METYVACISLGMSNSSQLINAHSIILQYFFSCLIDTEQSWQGLEVVPNLEGRGCGVYATDHFATGNVICDYQGHITENLSKKQLESYFHERESTIYIMQVEARNTINL